MNISEIYQELASFDDVEFVGGVSKNSVNLAEAELGLCFPPEYKIFIQEFGSGYVSSEEFIGLGGPKHHDVVWLTKELRGRSSNPLPHCMIPLRNDGYGNYDCIDTSKPTTDGEYQIVECPHGEGFGECKKLADSFSVWFREMLQLVRRLDAGDD